MEERMKDYSFYLNSDLGNRAWTFDRENPHVYQLFKRFAQQAKSKGHLRFSANAIFERIRWEVSVETTGEEWKMNNDYRAYYARKLMALEPEFSGFFEIRLPQAT